MYDRNTDSLWSQLEGTAVSGPLVGTVLATLPVVHTTWAHWQQRHPDTLVMAGDKRFRRLYRSDPYPGYTSNRRLLFAVKHKAPGTYHPKEPVLGIQFDGQAQAYPFVELRRAGLAEHAVTLAGRSFTVRWDADSETAWAEDAQGNPMTATRAFWFAWYAFHPDTHVYSAPDRN